MKALAGRPVKAPASLLLALLLCLLVVGALEESLDLPGLTLSVGLLATALGWFFWSGAQKKIFRLQRFSAAMTETNRLILRRPEPATLFEAICRICVTSWDADGAVLDVLDGKKTRRLASWGAVADSAESTPSSWHMESAEMRQSMTLLTLNSGLPSVSNDVQHDPRLCAWAAWCTEHMVKSVAALPLKRAGVTIGALLLFSKKANFFDATLLRLLGEMAADMSFALDNADREDSVRGALEQAERGQELFRTLFDAAPIPMVVFNVKGRRIVKVNNLVCALLQIRSAQLVGKTAEELGPGTSTETRDFFYETLRLQSRTSGLPSRLRSGTGPWTEVLLHAELVDYMGVPSVLVVATDVSEIRAAQVAVRARIAAEGANRAKTDFLSQMSHELRTPLNAVLGFAQLLAADPAPSLSPKQAQWVHHISRAGWHLLNLVDDVLDLSRIESGHLEVVTTGADLIPLLDEAIALNRAVAQKQNVELRDGYRAAGSISVTADPHRLRQVLVNLLSNAIKYNRRGGFVEVAVTIRADTVAIDVIDNGMGMTDEQLAHLFEPFNRLGRQSSAIEGAGIGLTLSLRLMEMMGGRLEVESAIDIGTKVRLLLSPCTPCGVTEPASRALVRPTDEPAPEGVVLYVEDDAVNRLIVEHMLLPLKGVKLLLAEDGARGLTSALALQPDLVLLDMQLPDMSGLDVLNALRSDPRTRSLRVVALSASAMREDMERAKALGAIDYWTKPLELQQFLAHVSSLLRSGRHRRELDAEARH